MRSLIVVAATAAPVWPRADDRGRLAFFHQIDGAADRRIFFPAHGFHRAIAHLDDLRGVDDLDPAIVAVKLFEFRFDLRRVADEKEFADMGILVQRQDCAADEIRRPEIATHGVQSDFHRSANLRPSGGECKIKKVEKLKGCPGLRGFEVRRVRLLSTPQPSTQLRADGQDLAALVIAAGRAGGVRRDGAAALGALVELRRLPAMRGLARAQSHLRSFAFWDSHKSESGKQEIRKRQRSTA